MMVYVTKTNAATLAELLDLLELLPPSKHAPSFWQELAEAYDKGWTSQYLVSNIEQPVQILRTGDLREVDELVRTLVQHCLIFFGHENDNVWRALDLFTRDFSPPVRGALGRRWAESVAEAAWALYVPLELARRRAEGTDR